MNAKTIQHHPSHESVLYSIGRTIVAGITAGIVILSSGFLTIMVFYSANTSLKLEYENQHLFRSINDPAMLLYFVQPFVLGILLSVIWQSINRIFALPAGTKSGIYFGLMYWLLTIPGLMMSYATFSVSFTMVLSWSVSVLVQGICTGLLFSKLLRKPIDH
jgi:hypothetical protein